MALISLMPMLFLVWMTAASFLNVSWIFSPGYAVWRVLWWSAPALHVKQCLLFSLWLSQPYQGQDLHLSCWSRNPSSVSELHCEVGGVAVLPLGEKPPSIPPPELSVRDCALSVIGHPLCRVTQYTVLALLSALPQPRKSWQFAIVSFRHCF